MHPVRKKRLYFIASLILGAGIAATLVLYALKQNINLFYSPTQLTQEVIPKDRLFRVGGLVKKGSVKRGDGLEVSFVITDTAHDVKVQYVGLLPDLFREGQGIVSEGRLNAQGVFIAEQVLAKHGADYKPPEVIKALKDAEQQRAMRQR